MSVKNTSLRFFTSAQLPICFSLIEFDILLVAFVVVIVVVDVDIDVVKLKLVKKSTQKK